MQENRELSDIKNGEPKSAFDVTVRVTTVYKKRNIFIFKNKMTIYYVYLNDKINMFYRFVT